MKFQQQSSKSMRASGQVISPILPHRCSCGKRFANQLAPKIAGTHSVEMNPTICIVAFLWVALAGRQRRLQLGDTQQISSDRIFQGGDDTTRATLPQGIDIPRKLEKQNGRTYREQLFEMLGPAAPASENAN